MKSMTDCDEHGLTVPQGNGGKVNSRECEQMMSVHEVCAAFGITRKRLYFYDKIDLLKPAARKGKQQEKMYTDSSLELLKLILTYQEAGLTLKEIRTLINEEQADAAAVLRGARNRLIRSRNRIDTQVMKLDQLIQKKEGENL